jgi:hypothetical protein
MRNLSVPAIHKHIKVLEKGDMIIRKKIGRMNFLLLNREALLGLQDWVMEYHTSWSSDEAALENHIQYLSVDHTKKKEEK